MNIDTLRIEFDKFLESKNDNYSDPEVVRKALETEKKNI